MRTKGGILTNHPYRRSEEQKEQTKRLPINLKKRLEGSTWTPSCQFTRTQGAPGSICQFTLTFFNKTQEFQKKNAGGVQMDTSPVFQDHGEKKGYPSGL